MLLFTIGACSYGPEQSTVQITSVAMRPQSHDLAFGVNFERFRPAAGINAFPNGGIPRVIEREARIYWCLLDQGVIRQVAAVPDYNGIPTSAEVWVMGWKGHDLYFRIHGYEQDATGGNDHDRPVEILYRVSDDGVFAEVSKLPGDLASQRNSGPAGPVPFLRYSRGYKDIEITIDHRFSEGGPDVRVFFREGSTVPVLEILP